MASQSRHERQLMRQRGAGRAVGSTDFGLDFGNAFLAPVRSSHSRSRTPAQNSSGIQRTSRTSTRRSGGPSHPQSRRSASNSVTPRSSAVRTPVVTENALDDVHRSAKRRKTVDGRSLEAVTNVTNTDTAAKASGSARGSQGATQTPTVGSGKANESSTKARTSTKRRKRKSIGQGSLFKKRKVSTGRAPTPQPAAIDEDEESEAELRGTEDAAEDVETYEEGDYEQDDEQMDEHVAPVSKQTAVSDRTDFRISSQPKKRRKKRKSIGQQLGRKKPAPGKGYQRMSGERVEYSPVVEEPATEPQQSADAESEPPGKKRTGGAAIGTRSPPIQPTGRENTSEDEDYEDESGRNTPEPPPAAPQSKKAKAAASSRAGAPTASNDRQPPVRSKASFPIVTHRLTGFDTLPTIDELGESEPDSEEERAHEAELRATLDRPHPNAVDVLGQYCRETVQAVVDRLNDGTAGNRSERKRKQAALEAVGRELDDQLVDMSAAVENRIQLTRRSRKAKKTKAELQSRWIEIRRQREEVALKCDEVRQQNWQREQDREQKWAISEAAHKLTLEAERADPGEEQQDDLEFLLRTLAENVSDLSGDGMLNRIQSFNGQLERMAEVLEGRYV